MKDSYVPWICSIPDDWQIKSLSQVASQVKNKNKDLLETNLLSLSYGKIKRKDIETNNGLLPASFDGYNIIESGDIVLRLTDLQNDHTSLRVGLATERGIITSAYTTIRPNDSLSKFLYYALHAFDIKKGFYGMGAGVRQGLTYDEIKPIKIAIPPYDRLSSINEYLDKTCKEIDALIQETRESIEDYKKLKLSVITTAVKNGVDQATAFEDCNISWIGKLPSGFSISKIKYVAQIFGRIGFRGYTTADIVEKGNGAISLSPSNMKDGKLDLKKCTYISWDKYNESPEIMLSVGDVIMVKTGASYGKTAYIDELPTAATLNPQLVVFKNITMNHKYFCYYMQTPFLKRQVDGIVTGGTIPTMSQEKMSSFIIIQPDLASQNRIVEFLDAKTKEIDWSIAQKESLLSDLETYKNSLIYETITGKKEVF